MAANKFATMLHRNTNKITLILIYAVLEWILILLLLLNSLFSYLIIKFAEFFGLKPPCPWCTRLDHIFDPDKGNKNTRRDLLCEVHVKEISQLGYCSNHQKLVESKEMCEDCLSSRPGYKGSAKSLTLFPSMKEFGTVQNCTQGVCANAELVSLSCSCCGVSLNYNTNDNNVYSSYVLVKTSSWDVLDSGETENLITEARDYEGDDNHSEKVFNISCDEKVLEDKNETKEIAQIDTSCLEVTEKGIEENVSSVSVDDETKELKGGEDEEVDVVQEMEEKSKTLIMKDKSVQVLVEEDSPKHLEYFLDYNGHGLVPFELIDSVTEEYKRMENVQIQDEDKFKNQELCLDSAEKSEVVMKNGSRLMEVDSLLDFDINEEAKVTELDSNEIEEDENTLVFHAEDCHLVEEKFEQYTMFPLAHFSSKDANDVQETEEAAGEEMHSDVHTACEEATLMANNETEADVSIGTEIPDLDVADELQNQEYVHSYECTNDDHCPIEEQTVQLQSFSIQQNGHPMNDQHSFQLELNETEEDNASETPKSYSDSFNQLHKKLLLHEKRDSCTEESLDGASVTSELECGEGVVTVDHLKSALRSERKALQVLYAELEEERSASAVAASQTMAMINRLQEEKAAMQMEALQYQRMMEEQSEYDQEALQLLNELMVKREKEKHDLEKELEVYRKKLFDYESREKMRRFVKSKDGSNRCGFSSASCSNAEDSDGLSIDLNQEAKEEEEFYSHEEYSNHNTPVDAVFKLEESLADFEEERLSILEHLKGLEEKLMTMEEEEDDEEEEEERRFEDVISMEENGDHVIQIQNGHLNGKANGYVNGFSSEVNGKHYNKRKSVGQNGKSLLPFFDAISDENEDTTILNGNGNGIETNGVRDSYESKFETESKKCAIEDEVDHLYERLQALEADREFLKHCISSMKKGDKGMDLLQEILQHLRDLRNVELRARNLSESAI